MLGMHSCYEAVTGERCRVPSIFSGVIGSIEKAMEDAKTADMPKGYLTLYTQTNPINNGR